MQRPTRASQHSGSDRISTPYTRGKTLDHAGFLLVANGLTWCIAHPEESEADGNGLDEFQRMFVRLT